MFEALCRNADANGDGEGAIAAAERLVALLPRRAPPGQLRLPRVVRVRIAEGLFALASWLSPEVARNEGLIIPR